MSRTTLRRLHGAASLVAFGIVAMFLSATVAVEVFGGSAEIETVKHWIVRALIVLVPAVGLAGLSGRRLAGGPRSRLVRLKLKRMQLIAATGLLVLVPCAFALDHLAAHGRLGATFAAVQVIELVAGASNLALLGLNFRDGMAMRARRTQERALVRAVPARSNP